MSKSKPAAHIRILRMNVVFLIVTLLLLAVPGGVIWQAFILWGILTLCATWASGVTQYELEKKS